MKNILTILFLSLLVLTILFGAVKWELNDIAKIYARRNVYDITNPKEKEKEYKFYSAFNYENHIVWRSLFVASVMASVTIYIYLKNYANLENLELTCFVVLFIIFTMYYIVHMFRNFHMYRVMASKVKKDYQIMETIGEKKIKKK